MITRTHDVKKVRRALSLYPFDPIDLDVDEFLSHPLNFALASQDDVGLFEFFLPRVYTGHYFFTKKTRGKKAIELSIQMLRQMFEDYDAEVIRGLPPIRHKASIWMARHLGFKKLGEVETVIGDCAIFVLTKNEFNSKYGNQS